MVKSWSDQVFKRTGFLTRTTRKRTEGDDATMRPGSYRGKTGNVMELNLSASLVFVKISFSLKVQTFGLYLRLDAARQAS